MRTCVNNYIHTTSSGVPAFSNLDVSISFWENRKKVLDPFWFRTLRSSQPEWKFPILEKVNLLLLLELHDSYFSDCRDDCEHILALSKFWWGFDQIIPENETLLTECRTSLNRDALSKCVPNAVEAQNHLENKIEAEMSSHMLHHMGSPCERILRNYNLTNRHIIFQDPKYRLVDDYSSSCINFLSRCSDVEHDSVGGGCQAFSPK